MWKWIERVLRPGGVPPRLAAQVSVPPERQLGFGQVVLAQVEWTGDAVLDCLLRPGHPEAEDDRPAEPVELRVSVPPGLWQTRRLSILLAEWARGADRVAIELRQRHRAQAWISCGRSRMILDLESAPAPFLKARRV